MYVHFQFAPQSPGRWSNPSSEYVYLEFDDFSSVRIDDTSWRVTQLSRYSLDDLRKLVLAIGGTGYRYRGQLLADLHKVV